MTTQHTPTPWVVVNDGYDIFIADLKFRYIAELKQGVYFGEGSNTDNVKEKMQEEQKANAEFIVRAVNSHEALLEAAKDAHERLSLFLSDTDHWENEDELALNNLGQAIAQAEEK